MTIAARVPRLAPGVRLREDKVRGGWVVLAPEKLFVPDEHALAVLKSIDGVRTVGEIVDGLVSQYDAPHEVIAADVETLLQDLAEKGAIRL